MRGIGLIGFAMALSSSFALAGCGPMAGAGNDTTVVPCGSGGPANCVPSGIATGGGSGAADSQGWTRHEIVDQSGFERPMTAFTMPVPPGWRAQSEMVWSGNGRCASGNPSSMIRMASGDGRAQIEYLHGFFASNYSDPFTARGTKATDNCILGTVSSGEQMIREVIVPRLRQGWQIQTISPVQPPPEITQIVQGAQGGIKIQGYAFHVLLIAPDGAQAEQMYVAGVVMMLDGMGTGIAPPIQNIVGLLWAARGPRENVAQLFQVGEQIRGALQYNPDWQERLNDHNRKMQRANTPRYRPTAPYNPSPYSPSEPGYDPTAPGISSPKAQRDRIDGIREVERCRDPDTGEVYEVSIHIGCR